MIARSMLGEFDHETADVLNHIVHHRAQLGVYLRMNDVPVPGMYGPSADDPRM